MYYTPPTPPNPTFTHTDKDFEDWISVYFVPLIFMLYIIPVDRHLGPTTPRPRAVDTSAQTGRPKSIDTSAHVKDTSAQ